MSFLGSFIVVCARWSKKKRCSMCMLNLFLNLNRPVRASLSGSARHKKKCHVSMPKRGKWWLFSVRKSREYIGAKNGQSYRMICLLFPSIGDSSPFAGDCLRVTGEQMIASDRWESDRKWPLSWNSKYALVARSLDFLKFSLLKNPSTAWGQLLLCQEKVDSTRVEDLPWWKYQRVGSEILLPFFFHPFFQPLKFFF